MLALLDGDLILYRCAASAEKDSEEVAISRVNELLDTLLEKTQADEYKFIISGKGNFRKAINPEYKANRTQPRPVHLDALRAYAIEMLGAEVTENEMETDDYLGIYQTDKTVIYSLDKDLLQIPGQHYRWAIGTDKWSKDEQYITVSEIDGLRNLYEQCLKGDKSDNVKGLANIGDKKAKKMLEGCTNEIEMINTCLFHYPTEEEFLVNAQCLYILRSFDDSYLSRYERVLNENC